MSQLGPDKALIFRITHVNNVEWILKNGLHSRNSEMHDPNYVEIGNPDLIGKRAHRVVPVAPGGTLSDYIPFYFTPYSPMLLNIKTGYNGITRRPMSEIAILISSLHELAKRGLTFVFTDRHAYLQTAEDSFSSDLKDLDRIDWKLLRARDFKRDPNDPGKFERYQAEALVHTHMPVEALIGIVCHGPEQQTSIHELAADAKVEVNVVAQPKWYV